MKKRLICMLLALSLLTCLLSGCMPKLPASAASASAGSASASASASAAISSSVDDSEPVSLTVFSQTANWSGAQAGWGATLLKDMFNIDLTIIPDTDGAYETRMESGELGDIVVWGNNGDQYKAGRRQGHALQLGGRGSRYDLWHEH
jgi:putative aldouronate transport system substrate-binding protein